VERDEWLRAAWRVTLAAKLDPKRLVFVDEMATNTSLTVGAARLVAARTTKGFLFGAFVRCLATGERTPRRCFGA
jgi:hypothetical protein